jgi:AcrR family transcriptional regulator
LGVKERREREKQELKQSILDAAREIASQDGWQSVTIRRVAEMIEYSPPTIYEHFESKDAILVELVREGFNILFGRLRAAFDATNDPNLRMIKLALAYCDFAWDHQELYQVMHGLGGASCSASDLPQTHEAQDIDSMLIAAIRDIFGDVELDPDDLHAALDIHWATLHGIVSLTMSGHLAGGRERAAQLIEQSVRDWIVAWIVAWRDEEQA